MITQKETKQGRVWSAPCFYKVQAGSLGISAGEILQYTQSISKGIALHGNGPSE